MGRRRRGEASKEKGKWGRGRRNGRKGKEEEAEEEGRISDEGIDSNWKAFRALIGLIF
jgi:hypothetical protein